MGKRAKQTVRKPVKRKRKKSMKLSISKDRYKRLVSKKMKRQRMTRKEKKLFQSCHILHKQGKYYIVHFKELFALDGKHANLTINDVQRRNRIAQLLADWGLISIVNVETIKDIAPLNQIKVLAYKDKGDWILETKYNIGSKKKKVEEAE